MELPEETNLERARRARDWELAALAKRKAALRARMEERKLDQEQQRQKAQKRLLGFDQQVVRRDQ